MAFDSKGLDDYIDVAKRIVEFRAKYPDGSLQPANIAQPFEIRQIAGTDRNGKEQSGTFIIYTAAAYRNPEDPRPGIGCAYEVFPGRTPYTAGSELQNAETAAWGRAIVAALAADTRAGIASQQEVRNRQAERSQPAGDTFENAAPAPPRQSSRPPAAPPSPEAIDQDAQVYADKAHTATTPMQIEDIHKQAREAGKVTALIRNPASGGTGKLAVFLDWKRKQLTTQAALSPDDPWAVAIQDAVDAGEGERILADARGQAGRGELDPARLALIEQAIEAAFPGLTAAAA